jgi:hypothetical protein
MPPLLARPLLTTPDPVNLFNLKSSLAGVQR